MIHGLDTGFLVAAEVTEHGEHTGARATLARRCTQMVGDRPMTDLMRVQGSIVLAIAEGLRRLRRVARIYGAEPRFLLASATIANPVDLAERLVGTPFELVDDDGAPRAGREIAMWNPPVIEQRVWSFADEYENAGGTWPGALPPS